MAVSTPPVPLLVSPTWSFDGDDGSWSTFAIDVGRPPQSFRVLPSTTGSEIWIPIPQACQSILINVTNCGDLRGVNDYDNIASSGFQTNASTSWETIGIYGLSTEQNLFGTSNNGLYGLDTVTLPSTANGPEHSVPNQTVAGLATTDFWLGSLGLGTATGNFSVEDTNIPSLLDTLKTQHLIPSLSFGYSAGASYASPQDFGGLVLGGYDRSRMKGDNLSTPLSGDNKETLALSVQSIIAQNVFGGTVSLITNGSALTATVDSTVSQLWLPQNVCDQFAIAFGLTYDVTTRLYLVNSTIHTQLLQMNPSVTFTVASNSSSSETINIVLPYAAFDLRASLPVYNYSTPYFPIRVAASANQYTLGRALLQETYVFVDWERQYFSLAQAIHQNDTSAVVPVRSPSDITDTARKAHGLSTGAIAGIAVGAFAVVALAAGLVLFFIMRSRRRQQHTAPTVYPEDYKGTEGAELHAEDIKPPELMSSPVNELQADPVGQELDGKGAEAAEMDGTEKARIDRTVYELP